MQNLNFRVIIGTVMILVYFGMAFMLAFSTFFNYSIESVAFRYILAAVFFVYAVYRSYRLLTSLKINKEETDD